MPTLSDVVNTNLDIELFNDDSIRTANKYPSLKAG